MDEAKTIEMIKKNPIIIKNIELILQSKMQCI